MNPVRVQFIREKLLEIAREEQGDDVVNAEKGNMLRGLDVLDVGCGGGLLSEVCNTHLSCIFQFLMPG
jgi:2-polyprenyl-6-hydroxyphenyl methylase/3-demethylubiquinone-9 3-methyltransferase